MKSRYVPLLAIGAAYCFLVMMFNVPIPDGTTAHAVGGVLVAVLLGPWAAVIAVSSALAIQALFFGDGGVLAFGANCFNMAFVMPMVGYGVYLLLTRRVSLTSPRRALAAGIGGYVGLNVAALCAAIEFGVAADVVPPRRRHAALRAVPPRADDPGDGARAPHASPARSSSRSPRESSRTCSAPTCRCCASTTPRFPRRDADVGCRRGGSRWRWAFIGLGVMAVLTPLGLLAPGGAFGEDART